jgi:hypothetical protein
MSLPPLRTLFVAPAVGTFRRAPVGCRPGFRKMLDPGYLSQAKSLEAPCSNATKFSKICTAG